MQLFHDRTRKLVTTHEENLKQTILRFGGETTKHERHALFTMSSSQTPHRTPLRRVSQGSLFALSRSAAYPDAPHGLGFIEPAMAEFADEVDVLQANTEGLKNLSESLATFNESFASWLYVMTMNALTTDWPQVCCPSYTFS